MIHRLAQKLAEYLNRELNTGGSRQAIIAYGLEIILGGIIKLVSFVAVPAALGILPQTWAALLASACFRLPAGGAHCTAYYRCLVGSLFTFSLIGAAAKHTAVFISADRVFYISISLALLSVALWAPADTEIKPVTRPGDRKKAKAWSYGVLVLYLYLRYYYQIPNELLLAGSLGLLSQVFTLTPLGYWAMMKLDRFLLKISYPLTGRREVS